MIRRDVSPGEVILEQEDERGRFWVVITGMLRSSTGRVVRPGEALGSPALSDEPLQAMTPAVVASCDRATFDELVRPLLSG
jgi:CRP-like cAMP-binding protein